MSDLTLDQRVLVITGVIALCPSPVDGYRGHIHIENFELFVRIATCLGPMGRGGTVFVAKKDIPRPAGPDIEVAWAEAINEVVSDMQAKVARSHYDRTEAEEAIRMVAKEHGA